MGALPFWSTLLIEKAESLAADFAAVFAGRVCMTRRVRLHSRCAPEVAAHLAIERTAGLAAALSKLSDAVLLSAAIPFRGGASHVNVNEQ